MMLKMLKNGTGIKLILPSTSNKVKVKGMKITRVSDENPFVQSSFSCGEETPAE
jgi:hypothetical protein